MRRPSRGRTLPFAYASAVQRSAADVRREAYTEILRWGVLAVRRSAFGGNLALCEIEADHIHNLPSLLEETDEARHAYYKGQERSCYLERLDRLRAAEYLCRQLRNYRQPWTALADALVRAAANGADPT